VSTALIFLVTANGGVSHGGKGDESRQMTTSV